MERRFPIYFAAGTAVLLVVFSLAGDNGVVYVAALLGVPVASGVLAGRGLIRFWHAVVACLAVIALDVVFDETWAEDLVFFAVLAVLMVGVAAVARLITRKLGSRTERVTR